MAPRATSTALLSVAFSSLLCVCTSTETVKDPDERIIVPGAQRIVGGAFTGCPCSPSGRGFSRTAMDKMKKAVKGSQEKGLTDSQFRVLDKCAEENGMESCMNADRVLRYRYHFPFCSYDSATGRNVYDRMPNVTGNITEVSGVLVTAGSCDLSNGTKSPDNMVTERLLICNEGCVAVEHLKGYVLQHRTHLWRLVLCSKGFCATPNHGIEVSGRLTSMKHMCASGEWACVERMKLVNNLKISQNRRAKISEEITVTPYDVRFPKAAVWAVQILEDILHIFSISVLTGAVAAVSLLAFSSGK